MRFWTLVVVVVVLALYSLAGSDDRMSTELTREQRAEVVARWEQ